MQLMKNMASDARELTIDQCLDIIPLSFFQYRLLALCGVLFMADAMEVILLSFLTACAVFAGQLIGTCFWGPFADVYGRRTGYLCACAVTSVFGVLSGLSPNFACLLTFRSLVGFGIAGLTVPFDLLAEFLPAKKRGSFLLYIEYFWTFGSVLVVILAWNLLDQYGWRLLAMLNAVPFAVSGIVGYFYLDESPRWLMVNDHAQAAEDILRRAARLNDTDLGSFVLHVTAEEVEEAEMQRSLPLLLHYAQLFAEGVRATTFPILVVWMFSSFAYYGVVLFASKIYDKNFGAAANATCSFDFASIFDTSSAEFVGIILAIFLITPVGRVNCQAVGYGVCGVFTMIIGILEAFGTKYHRYVLVCGMVARCAAMMGICCTWVHTPELFSTNVRATAHSLCNMGAKISGIFVSFLVFSDAVSNMDIAIILSLSCFGAVSCALVLPETSGKTLDGISISNTAAEERVFSDDVGGDEDVGENDALELVPLGMRNSSGVAGGGRGDGESSALKTSVEPKGKLPYQRVAMDDV